MPETLDDVVAQLHACHICREQPTDRRLPHEPRPVFQISKTARLFVCSQAPGIRAHTNGIPFSDPSGARLRAWMGVSEAEFYDAAKIGIIPMGFCFPGHDKTGGDLPPRPECAPFWRARIFAALPQAPELILLVGSHAQRWHLGKAHSMAEILKEWRRYASAPEIPRYLPLPHPSWRNSGWLKRNPWFEAEVLPYLRSEVRRLIAE